MARISHSALQGLFLGFLGLVSGFPAAGVVSPEPTSITVTPSYLPGVVENTHTSTIGQDGHATPVPVVGGSQCWFCPKYDDEHGPSGAWALLGIDSPGIYQPSPVPELFTEPVPVITVPASGDPVYNTTPTSTTSERTKVAKEKRDKPIPTVYDNEKTENFKQLEKYLPLAERNVQYTNGVRFALSGRSNGDWHGLSVPGHYLLAEGPVVATIPDDPGYPSGELDPATGTCSITKITKKRHLDWQPTRWDLFYSRESKRVFCPKEEKLDPEYWEKMSWRFLGRTRDDADNAMIRREADNIIRKINADGGYNTILRNCREFALSLYGKIRYKPPRGI